MTMLRRPLIVLACVPVYVAMMFALGTFLIYFIVHPLEGTVEFLELLLNPQSWEVADRAWWVFVGVPVLMLIASQCAFVLPMWRPTVQTQPTGKPLLVMIIAAALTAAVLCMGLLFSIGGVVQLLWSYSTGEDPANFPIEDEAIWAVVIVTLALLLASWVFWTIALIRFMSNMRRDSRFDRIVGLLLAGTVVETLVVLPVDILIRRRTECYCSTGTFYSLVLSAWALLWLAGPGAFLVLTRKRRRAWADQHCARCGYGKGPTPAAQCPECGFAWSTR